MMDIYTLTFGDNFIEKYILDKNFNIFEYQNMAKQFNGIPYIVEIILNKKIDTNNFINEFKDLFFFLKLKQINYKINYKITNNYIYFYYKNDLYSLIRLLKDGIIDKNTYLYIINTFFKKRYINIKNIRYNDYYMCEPNEINNIMCFLDSEDAYEFSSFIENKYYIYTDVYKL